MEPKFSLVELEKMLNDAAYLSQNLVAVAKQLHELQPDYPELEYMINGYSEYYGENGKNRSSSDHSAMFANRLDNQKYDIARCLIKLLRIKPCQ